MTAPRTVTVPTLDHGPVTLACPTWCLGHGPEPEHRIDISHVGTDEPLTLLTRRGRVVHLVTALESRPFVTDPFLRRPFVNVAIGGDWYPTGLPGLEAMAAQLEADAEALRERARQLAVILAEDTGR